MAGTEWEKKATGVACEGTDRVSEKAPFWLKRKHSSSAGSSWISVYSQILNEGSDEFLSSFQDKLVRENDKKTGSFPLKKIV